LKVVSFYHVLGHSRADVVPVALGHRFVSGVSCVLSWDKAFCDNCDALPLEKGWCIVPRFRNCGADRLRSLCYDWSLDVIDVLELPEVEAPVRRFDGKRCLKVSLC
jgi:hypothetical protein